MASVRLPFYTAIGKDTHDLSAERAAQGFDSIAGIKLG
jgi:hypothetical protein